MADTPVQLAQLDVGQAALFLGWATQDAVMARLVAAGHDDVRPGHGFVIQRLVGDAHPTPSEIAEAIGVSTASVSRSLRELSAGGYVTQEPDPRDGRRRRVRLTARGRAMVETARQARQRVDDELATAMGAVRFEELRHRLQEALAVSGLRDSVESRRLRDRSDVSRRGS